MIDGTNGMLEAFPDRLLLGDDVIVKGDCHSGYSSHRVLSPMTNSGASQFGPATGRQVRIMNMADCVVEEGVIVREWLARDNLALVRQLGFDALACAKRISARYTDSLEGLVRVRTRAIVNSKRCDANSRRHRCAVGAAGALGIRRRNCHRKRLSPVCRPAPFAGRGDFRARIAERALCSPAPGIRLQFRLG